MTYDPLTGYGERPRSSRVYGRAYELFTTRPDLDGEHPYVGKTRQTIHQRVHGRSSSAHTSPQSVAKDPWKARIRPGRAGYRLLETVYATGDVAADERELRRVEAFWIDRIRPTHNTVRPVRPPVHTLPARAPRAPRRAYRPSAPREHTGRTRARRRVSGFLALFAVTTALVAWLVAHMDLPWPAAPWVASPVGGLLLALPAFSRLDRTVRRVTGRR